MLAASKSLFDYKPERVALTGYRCAMAGYDHGDASCWDELWSHLVEDAGLAFACDAMGSLQYFVRAMREATGEETRYYPPACQRLCRRECLMLTLLSAQQHREAKSAAFALKHLFREEETEAMTQAIAAASGFAQRMAQANLMLLPIPLSVIQPIMGASVCKMQCHLALQ